MMSPTERDFLSIGLTPEEWRALILGRGPAPVLKLEAARAAIARIGGISEKRAGDPASMDRMLRQIATMFPQYWLKGEALTHAEKVRYMQAKKDCTEEEAEKHLADVAERKAAFEQLQREFGG